jgi:hypothetical protein
MRFGLSLVYCLFAGSFGALVFPASAYGQDEVRQKEAPIIGGKASARDNVVYVATHLDDDPDTDDRGCTGSIISPKLVLTARHCVSAFVEGTFGCTIEGNINENSPRTPTGAGGVGLPYDPDWIRIYLGSRAPETVDKTRPEALRVRDIFVVETSSICRNDIAVIELEEPVDIEPIALRLDKGVRNQESTNLVGFGLNDDSDTSQHEIDGIRIVGVGPSEFFPNEGQAPPRTFSLGRGPCPGDSGGPALSSETGAVLGVFSFFKGKCESTEVYNYYTQIAAFADFLRGVFERTGGEPNLEKSPDDGSGGSAGAANVADGGQDASVGGSGLGEDGDAPAESRGCAWSASKFNPGWAAATFALLVLFTFRRWKGGESSWLQTKTRR